MMAVQAIPWSLSFFCFLSAIRLLIRRGGGFGDWMRGRSEKALLVRVSMLLHEFEETLSSGLIPEERKWAAMRELPAPWGVLIHESLRELRSRGGALVPTLRRLRDLAESHGVALSDAHARSSQARAQALVCAAMVPCFGAALHLLLPGPVERPWAWLAACTLAVFLALCGALWVLRLSDRARWAGLSAGERPWVLASQCAGEKFLSLVRGGTPADQAWIHVVGFLSVHAPGLARAWGGSVFEEGEAEPSGPHTAAGTDGSCRHALIQSGATMKRAIQLSLMEGRPCAERVESVLRSLRSELRACVDRELTLLGTRALQPLFVFVAPPLLGLLAFGLWLSWKAIGA